jgi:hypothetical protein
MFKVPYPQMRPLFSFTIRIYYLYMKPLTLNLKRVVWHGVCLVVANGASMRMVEGSIPTAPRSSYNGSCSDHGLKGNLVKLVFSISLI